ncbi:MAG: hypothetical protein OXE87_08030 [Chloroflexi bacterium]|nr:hypothetical protein [Chloroflexota bacterium]
MAVCDRLAILLDHDVRPPLELHDGVIAAEGLKISIGDLWDVYRGAVDAGADVRWPLAPLVNAWQQRPRPVEPNRRLTDRVIPARLAMAETSNNPRLLFSPAAHAEYGPDGKQLVMPGFANVDTPSPALPLALYDLGAGPTISPGRGAPLALRMFVESVLSVPMQERERGQPVAMSVSLREFLKWLYPTRTPSPAEYWPRLMAAVEALDSWDARVPLYDPQTKRNELRRVVSVGGIPRGPGALDESVRIIVDLPPGSGNGPQVSDNLRQWGVKSAPAYRLLINLAYQWHNPGVTIIPIGKGKTRHWVQVNDPDRYSYIRDDDLVALAFPSSAVQNRRVLLQRTKSVVTQLRESGELRIMDGKIIPPDRR